MQNHSQTRSSRSKTFADSTCEMPLLAPQTPPNAAPEGSKSKPGGYVGRLFDRHGVRVDLWTEYLRSQGGEAGRWSLASLVVEIVRDGTKEPRRYYSDEQWLRDEVSAYLDALLTAKGIRPTMCEAAIEEFQGALLEARQSRRLPDTRPKPVAKSAPAPVVVKQPPEPELPVDWKTELEQDPPLGIAKAVWTKIVRRESHCCLCCLEELRSWLGLTYHHLLPRSMDGKATASNCVACCRKCHDRLEDAQEAMLFAKNVPPRRLQLYGIFTVDRTEKEIKRRLTLDDDWHLWVYGGQRPPAGRSHSVISAT